jgi:hypothetical protein
MLRGDLRQRAAATHDRLAASFSLKELRQRERADPAGVIGQEHTAIESERVGRVFHRHRFGQL